VTQNTSVACQPPAAKKDHNKQPLHAGARCYLDEKSP
jgi:hypothetical protein